MAAPDIAELGLSIRSDGVVVASDRLDEFEKKAGRAEKASERLAKRMDRLSNTAGRLGRNLTIGITAPMAAASAASIKLAIDAEEAANKFDVVFRGSVQESRKELQRLTRTIPLTRTQMEEMAAGIQDMLVPMGVARGQAAGMSVDMVKLAGDLASFNNTGTENVLMAMQSALAGSSEPMRRFGVDTRETRLQQLALEEGLIGVEEELNNTTRAQAVLMAIMEDSTDAMGDAERTMDAAANQIRFLQRDVRQLSEDLGKELIPIFREGLASVREWVTWFKNLDIEQQRQIAQYAAMAAALGPLLLVFSGLLKILANLVIIGPKVAVAFRAMLGPIGLLVTAIGGISAAILLSNRRFEEMASVSDETAQSINLAMRAFSDGAEDAAEAIGQAMFRARVEMLETKNRLEELQEEIERRQNQPLADSSLLGGAPPIQQQREVEALTEKTRELKEEIRELRAAKAVEAGEDIFSRIEDGVSGLARKLGLLEGDTEDAADATDKATISMEGLSEIIIEVSEKTSTVAEDIAEMEEAYLDLVSAANPAVDTLRRMVEAQEEINKAQRNGFTITEQQRQAILAQAAGLNQWATQQDIVNKLLLDAGVPEETLQTWREFVDLMSRAAGLGPRMSRIEAPGGGGSGGGGDGGLFDSSMGQEQAIQQTAQVASNAAMNALGLEAGIGSAIGGIAGAFIAGPIGAALGALQGAIFDTIFSGSADDGPPEFGISTGRGSAPGDPRTTSPVFDTDIVGHHFDDITAAAFQQILDSLAQFDREIAQIFDPSDFDAITTAFANFDETFEEGAATLEEAMKRRFITALRAAEPAVASFVESFGDLENMQRALRGIFDMRDAIDDFGNIMLSLGGPVDQLTARLNRMQTGIEDAQTSFDQAMLAQDPAAIARAGQELQRAIVEKFELEKQLIRNLQSQLRELELSSRDFAVSMAERIADVGGPRDLSGLVQTTIANRQAARQDVLNADDTQQALRDLDRFVAATDEWLDAARRRVTELRDMELERIQGQIQTLETEAQEILGRGRERAQQQAQAAQRASQAAAQARQAELDAINEQLEQAREWQSVLDSTRQMIDNLTFSQTNPASRFSRLGMLNDRIQGQDVSTPEGARELQELLQRRLDLGQQLFQRGSPEFESLFNNTMRRLSEIEDKAKSEAQIANDLQRQANELQSQTTGSVSAGTQQQIILSREEQRRLEEIRAEQAALEEEAQQVREDAEAALQRIDEQARQYYQWARNKREKLEEKRHGEIVSELEAITGGMDPDSYIAMRQAEVVDRLTSIRDLMQEFLSSIQGQASGSTNPNPNPSDPPGGGGPFIPGQPQAGTKNVTFNVNVKGGSKRDTDRLVTHLKREFKTA